ncbi:MAG: hypothetical protein E6Q75_10455 [Rheinheimera sp.]|nr:MAG: hypothetical protein E6Q75_10455 [Rheinheimera sp.]
MRRFWQRYQQVLQRCCLWFSPRQLQLSAAFCLTVTVLLFVQPQRSEWLLFPLLLLLWSLLLLFARQMFLEPPANPGVTGFFARCCYWLRLGWYQLMLLLFLLLCVVALAFSLKLAGVILRALLV